MGSSLLDKTPCVSMQDNYVISSLITQYPHHLHDLTLVLIPFLFNFQSPPLMSVSLIPLVHCMLEAQLLSL